MKPAEIVALSCAVAEAEAKIAKHELADGSRESVDVVVRVRGVVKKGEAGETTPPLRLDPFAVLAAFVALVGPDDLEQLLETAKAQTEDQVEATKVLAQPALDRHFPRSKVKAAGRVSASVIVDVVEPAAPVQQIVSFPAGTAERAQPKAGTRAKRAKATPTPPVYEVPFKPAATAKDIGNLVKDAIFGRK